MDFELHDLAYNLGPFRVREYSNHDIFAPFNMKDVSKICSAMIRPEMRPSIFCRSPQTGPSLSVVFKKCKMPLGTGWTGSSCDRGENLETTKFEEKATALHYNLPFVLSIVLCNLHYTKFSSC